MSRFSGKLNVVSTFCFVAGSRVVGILREMIIAIVYGFSSSTDLFYQLTALPTYILTFSGGPFTTALAATANQPGAPGPRAYLPKLRRRLLQSGVAAGLLLWCGALAFAMLHQRRLEVVVGASFIAPAAALVTLLGLGTAFMNTRGLFARAQGLLFFNNVAFVTLIAIGNLFRKKAFLVTPVLCGAYLVAAILGAWLSRRFSNSEMGQESVAAAPIPGFIPSLSYASLETGGFIATQFIVLFCASHAAVGTASAAVLAQRIALSVQGLIVLPATNMLMVKIAQRPERQRAIFLTSVLATFGGLAAFAAAVILALGPAVHFLTRHSHGPSSNAALLASLLPSFLVWLVALGTNAMVARLLFAIGRGRLYTLTTLAAYAAANLARVVAFFTTSFANVVLWGALVELAVVGMLTIGAALAMRREFYGSYLPNVGQLNVD